MLTPVAVFLMLLPLAGLTRSDEQAKGTSFSAAVDSKQFEPAPDQLYRGLVTNKNGSLDGRVPARTVISIVVNGLSYNAAEGRLFNEAIQFEMNYLPSVTGEPTYYAVAMQFVSANYFMLRENSKLKITSFEWESDKKHFLLSADFDCTMRSWGYPADNKKDVRLIGSLKNVRVTVPSWLNSKN